MSDQKESLKSGRKPDLSYLHKATAVYIARACEYGNAKGYTRGNYIVKGESKADALARCRAYVAAILRHTLEIADSLERDGDLFCADSDTAGDFPASGLPHIAGVAASVNMLLEIAIGAGLLPADPGQPWTQTQFRESAERILKQRRKTFEKLKESEDADVEKNAFVASGSVGSGERVTIDAFGYRTEYGPHITKRIAPCGCTRYARNSNTATEHYSWRCDTPELCGFRADRPAGI